MRAFLFLFKLVETKDCQGIPWMWSHQKEKEERTWKEEQNNYNAQGYYSLVIQSSMGIVGLIKDHMGEWFELQLNWDWDGCSSQDPQPCWKGQRGRLFRNSEHGRGKEFSGWLFSKFSTTNVVAWWKLRRIFGGNYIH